MKVRNALVLTASLFASSAAFAGQGATQGYLVDHGFIERGEAAVQVVDRQPVEVNDAASAYLIEAGFIDAPSVSVDGEAPSMAEYSEVEQVLIDWGYLS